jgi:hypothetical protein
VTLHHDDDDQAPQQRPRLRPVADDQPPFDPDYDTPTGRTPPHDLAAEQALLGAVILQPDLAPDLATHIDPADFYRPQHETIWRALQTIAGDTTGDTHTDAVLLAAELHRTGHLERIGGAPYLHDLAAACPLPENAPQYATLVRDTARLRAAITTGTKITQLGYTGDITKVDAYLGDAVQALDDAVTRWGPRDASAHSGFRDLTWILTGQAPEIPPPTYVQHDAGHALFYAGKVNGVFGDPETAKTWLAQTAIVEALNNGETAAMIDVDHNGENHTAARLLLLGARPEHLADPDRFRYYDPQDGDELRHAISDITARRLHVVLVDSLGEIFPMLGLNTNDGDEVTGGLRLISQPAQTGACVIFIDHLPKATDARASGYAIGSIAKKRAVRGAYIRAEERTKPAPGQIGKISLYVEKDTAGQLRQHTPGGKFVGTFVLDSTQPHITTWHIQNETPAYTPDGRFRPTHLMEKISRHVEDNDLTTRRAIQDATGGKSDHVSAALQTLIAEGFISLHKGARGAHLHHSIALYREAEDDTLNHTRQDTP